MTDGPITEVEVIPAGQNALEQLERASIDMQITTAKRYPREIGRVKRDMLSFATLDQETAESCFYSLPRGGKTIQGPSVRMAEIALSCFGNIKAATRVIDTVTTGDAPHVTIQAVCHDTQNNVMISIEKRRRIVGKKSKGGQIDEDDINLATNAGSAIAIRDAIFKVIPGALIKPVYEQAKLVAIGTAKTLADRRAAAFEKFAKMGVDQPRVLAFLGKSTLDDVGLSDLETLFGLFTAIKDGATDIDSAFPRTAAAGPTGKSSIAEARDAAASEKSAPAPMDRARAVEILAAASKIAGPFKRLMATRDLTPENWQEGPDRDLIELAEIAEKTAK